MKILVTGGAGFIGSNLIKRLLAEGHNVHSLDNYSSGTEANHIDGCRYFTGDIENIYTMDKDIELIFHFAAVSRIQPSFNNPSESFRVNVAGTQAVCEFAHKINARLIYAGSSSKHYSSNLNNFSNSSPYATYKQMGEDIVKMFRACFHLNADIVRFYNVYGPGEIVEGDMAAVIGTWRNQVKQKNSITIVGDGNQKRDFTHIDDIVDALILLLDITFKASDAWELGTGINYSINQVAEWFCNRFETSIKYVKDQKGNYRETLRKGNLALVALGWKPKDKLKEYINTL